MSKKTKVIIIILIILLLTAFFMFFIYKNSLMPFNHNVWVESKNIDGFIVREKMARYILRENTLMGKSKDEIDQLLGESASKQDTQNKLYYEISEKYGNDIDPIAVEFLIVFLDQKGKAIRTEISTINTSQIK